MTTCNCGNCNDYQHQSDCAVHNEPAYPNGPCRCVQRMRMEEDTGPEVQQVFAAGWNAALDEVAKGVAAEAQEDASGDSSSEVG